MRVLFHILVPSVVLLSTWLSTNATTMFQDFRLPPGKGLFSYVRFVLCVCLHIKIWQPFGKRFIYKLVPYYVYLFVSVEPGAFACLTCAKSWQLSDQSSVSKLVSSVVHACPRNFDFYSRTVNLISNRFSMTGLFRHHPILPFPFFSTKGTGRL